MPRIPYKPNREDDHSSHHADIHERLFEGVGLFIAGAGISIVWDGSQYKFTNTGIGGTSESGWKWKSPDKELDYGLATSPGTFCYLTASNPLVTDGAYDLVTGELVLARPGVWFCAQAVPAAVTDPPGRPAGLYYNVPTLPYPPAGPVSSVGAAGSMAGDLDQEQDASSAKSVYWIYFGGYVGC